MKLINTLFLVYLSLLQLSANGLAQEKSVEEKEAELIDYSSLRDVLLKDGLEQEVIKKKETLNKIQTEQKKVIERRYTYPKEEDFWSFASEYWLVKNAPELSWDTPRPDYGIAPAFKKLLEQLGYYHYKFKILVLDTPQITHMGLPADGQSGIYLLSLPFMRSLDLSKVEISLVLLEDFIRLREGHFKSNLNIDAGTLGKNFIAKEFDQNFMKISLKNYSEVVFNKGFNFQQQFELTKKMDGLLKSHPEIWNAYFHLLSKIDRLVKENKLFTSHNKIYPSPELQLEWLKPKKRIP